MPSVVPSATLDTASAPLATNPPAVAKLDDAGAANTAQDGADAGKGGAAAAAANGQESAAGKASATDASTSLPATDTSATTTPSAPAKNPPPGGAAADKSSSPPPAAPTDSAKGGANEKTNGATPPTQNSQDTPAPPNTANSNSSSNTATPTVGGSPSDTSASSVAAQSSASAPSASIPSVAGAATTAPPPAAPTFDGSSSSGADTQAQTTGLPPSPNSLSSTNSGGNSFLQNKPLVIGLGVAGGLLIALFLIYAIVRCMRSRRRRQLDREMDDSFEETMNRWRPPPTVSDDHAHNEGNGDLRRAPSAMSTASASYAAYTEPPMAVASQQPNYGFGYPAQQQEYWTAAPPPQMSMAMGGAPAMGMAPGMMMQQQQQQAQWEGGLVYQPSQPAPPQMQTRGDYLSNYTSPAPAPQGAESPVSSTPMPNPFDERVLKVANE